MVMTRNQRIGILLALALAMAATRVNLSLFHHDVRDASWAIFFLAGFWLRGNGRWVFPLLMAEAVLIDYVVISHQGLAFWEHYCVSAAYAFLIPSYFSLWLGGSWLASHRLGLNLRSAGLAIAALLLGWAACYLLSNGSYYWLSSTVPQPRSFNAWSANLQDWYLPYLVTMSLYVGIGALLHALAVQLARMLKHADQPKLR